MQIARRLFSNEIVLAHEKLCSVSFDDLKPK